ASSPPTIRVDEIATGVAPQPHVDVVLHRYSTEGFTGFVVILTVVVVAREGD
ncbi:unnamed protein product, partial [Rotaria magnacalcarata]